MTRWVIGKRGMLATSFINYFREKGLAYLATGHDEVDITNQSQAETFLQNHVITEVINASAYTFVDRAEEEMEKAYALNAQAPIALAALLKRKGIRLVHFSTDFVFDGEKIGGFREEDEARGSSIYGTSKLAGDEGILALESEALIVRISWLYGPGSHHFVGKILKKLEGEGPITVVDDHRGSLTHADDVVQAVMKLQDQTGLMHFSGRGVSSWYEVAKFIEAHKLGANADRVVPIKYESLGLKTPRPSFSYLNCTKYESLVKEPIGSWQERLLKYLEEPSYERV